MTGKHVSPYAIKPVLPAPSYLLLGKNCNRRNLQFALFIELSFLFYMVVVSFDFKQA